MRDQPDQHITVVLPTCDRPDDLRSALATVVRQDTGGRFTYDVVVVDDGSSGTAAAVVHEAAASTATPVQVVRTHKAGVARARNAGTDAARGPWIACFDDDQRADPAWLAQLLAAAARSEALCVGGSRSLDLPAGVQRPLSSMARVLLGEHTLPPGSAVYPPDMRVLPNTGNALIHRSVFERVGGFDPSYQGGSDTDFFWRVINAGCAIAYAPAAHVVHVIPASRVAAPYLRWVARKVGAASARVMWRNQGPGRVAAAVLQRAIVTAARDVPLLTVRALAGNRAGCVDSSCTMAYSWAYARAALSFAVPSLFAGTRYAASLDFRRHGGERADPAT